MNDDTVMLPGRPIEVQARFILQAAEHLRSTSDRYVTLMFVDDVCVGVNTRRLIVDQSTPLPPTTSDEWTLQKLTDSVILGVLAEHGPINAKEIGDYLQIAGADQPLRQRIHRVLTTLVTNKTVRRTGNPRRPNYVVSKVGQDGKMPVRPATKRKIKRKDITTEIVVALMRDAGEPLTSRSIGDMLGVARPDNMVRSKITEVVKGLLETGQARRLDGTEDGGRRYELVDGVTAATQ